MMAKKSVEDSKSVDQLYCRLCHTQGEVLYSDVHDPLYNLPGSWTLMKCPNSECGLIWLHPKPTEEVIQNAYFDNYTHIETPHSESWIYAYYKKGRKGYLANKYGYYSNSLPGWEKLLGYFVYLGIGRSAKIDGEIMYLGQEFGGYVLDIGCGNGQFVKQMNELGWKSQGVDFDPIAIERAKAKDLDVRLGTLESIHFPDNSFDAITMSHVLEHLDDPSQTIRECYRILKPGGRLVLITPNSDSWCHQVFKKYWFALQPPQHLQLFNPSSLRLILTKASFYMPNCFTNIRYANSWFLGSYKIYSKGRYKMGSEQPFYLIIFSKLIQLWEAVLVKVKPEIGEELIAIAQKGNI